MRSFIIDADADGRVRWQGVDTGITELVAVNEKEGLLVLKIRGHISWVNRMVGHQYMPARFEVHRFREMSVHADGSKTFDLPSLFGIMDWPVQKKRE